MDPVCAPPWLIARWKFPARGGLPPVELTWYHGGKWPPLLKEHNMPHYIEGLLFVGADGMLIVARTRDHSDLGPVFAKHELYPKEKFANFQRLPWTIPESIGHFKEWLGACKGSKPPLSNLDYSSPLTETVLLGTVAYRVGEKLQWAPMNLRATNCPEADLFIRREYREGSKNKNPRRIRLVPLGRNLKSTPKITLKTM